MSRPPDRRSNCRENRSRPKAQHPRSVGLIPDSAVQTENGVRAGRERSYSVSQRNMAKRVEEILVWKKPCEDFRSDPESAISGRALAPMTKLAELEQ